MEGFDTITMSYLTPSMPLPNATADNPLAMPLLPLDNLEQNSNFDADTFVGYVLRSPWFGTC